MLKKRLMISKLSLLAIVISMTVSGCSLNLIPLAVEEKGINWLAYVIATVFYLGLIITLISTFLVRSSLKIYRDKLISKGVIKDQKLPGIINFTFNIKNIVIYSVILIGLVLIITDIKFDYIHEFVMFPIISITILSFTLHSVFDGKYYKLYKLIKENLNHETKK